MDYNSNAPVSKDCSVGNCQSAIEAICLANMGLLSQALVACVFMQCERVVMQLDVRNENMQVWGHYSKRLCERQLSRSRTPYDEELFSDGMCQATSNLGMEHAH
jgi:hypothetical protein